MNLFAVTDTDVWRIPLSGPVQTEVAAMFRNQEEEFDSSFTAPVNFDGKYKPDDFECLVIPDFQGAARMLEAIQQPLQVPAIPASSEILARIKALFTGYFRDEEMRVLVQRFDKRQVLSSRGISIFHSADTFKKLEGPGLTLDWRLSAVIRGQEVRFRSFHVLRQLFDNVAQYYVEATDTDIDSFGNQPCLKVNANDLKAAADTWIRRKIALVAASDILATVPVAELVTAAREFGITLVTETPAGGTEPLLVVPTMRSDLVALLRFLDEDYYKSPLSEARYMTNSKRRLD